MSQFRYTTVALENNQHLVKIQNNGFEVYCIGYENNKRKTELDGWYFPKEVTLKTEKQKRNKTDYTILLLALIVVICMMAASCTRYGYYGDGGACRVIKASSHSQNYRYHSF